MANRNQNSTPPLLRREVPRHGSRGMKRKHAICVTVLLLALPLWSWGQGSDPAAQTGQTAPAGQSAPADQEPEGRIWGAYTVHQSIEFGGHIVGAAGNEQMYKTYVNLNSGPRLLGQELTMEASPGAGGLFDRLYINNFGFGGDPENLARLRISKAQWYNFVGLYRRDRNFFDYNLFANPLNQNLGSNVYVPFVNATTYTGAATANGNFNPQAVSVFTNSPHLQDTTRNMGDFTLTLLPESAISFRLGFTRNNTAGRIDTTAGQPFVTLLTEDSTWRSDRWSAGADVKVLPRTTVSGDFFFEHDKNDLSFRDNNRLLHLGSTTGLPVDIGLQFFPAYQTSATSGLCTPQPAITAPGVFVLSPTCTAVVLNFFKQGNVRTDIFSGQLSLASNYFDKLDITASGTYSSADSELLNFNEFNFGLSPALLRGSANTTRISTGSDLGLTYHFSKTWSVSDRFRWYNWREPGALNLATFTCSHAAGSTLLSAFLNPCGQAPAFALITATNPAASLAGNATTGTFNSIALTATLLGERSYYNTVKLNWEPSRLFRAYAGYRYGRRELRVGTGGTGATFAQTTTISNQCQLGTAACAPTPAPTISDVEAERIDQHSALLGVVLRPFPAWRINADAELLSGNNAFTLISPRHQQRVRAYTTFKVNRWASVNGGVHFVETRNRFGPSAVSESGAGAGTPLFPAFAPGLYGHKDHWRWYSAGLSLTPSERVTFDVGWTLLDQDIKSATCMPLPTDAFPFTNPITIGNPAALNCTDSPAVAGSSWSTSFARALLLDYTEETNAVHLSGSFAATKRVTLSLGYELTGDNGRTTWLRGDTGQPLQVAGDVFGNVPFIAGNLVGGANALAKGITGCPVNSTPIAVSAGTGCLFAGPFPDQPLGPQAINWHKASAGIEYQLTKTVSFRGFWGYYDYNAKDQTPEVLVPAGSLRVVSPRSFHANVGTLSLKYSF